MAKLNMYDQQTAFNAPRADASAFGGGTAAAMGQAGGAAFDLGVQMKRREDVIDRVGKLGEGDAFGLEAVSAFESSPDVYKKETLDGFSQGIRQKFNDIYNQHAGTAQSKAELKNQLDNQANQYIKSATAVQMKAQQQFIGQRIEQKTNALAIAGANAPDTLPLLFEELDADLASYGDALPPAQLAAYKEGGRSAIAVGVLDNLDASENWPAVKAMMANPEVHKYLDRNAARRFNIAAAVGEGKATADAKRREANVRTYERLAGGVLTPEQRQRAYDLPDEKNMTPADKITAYELVTRKPAPQAVIDKIFDVESKTGSGIFGNGLQGKSMSFVTDNAVAYANGFLPPDQARVFEAAYAEAYQPSDKQDPVTGRYVKVTPTVPQFAREAMERGSAIYGGLSTGSMAPGTTPRPGETVQLDINGQTMGRAVVDANGKWTMPAPPEPGVSSDGSTDTPSGGPRLWDLADKVAGPVAGVKRVIGGGPVPMGIGGDEVRAAKQAELQGRNLVRALQQNPRYAEGERKSIAEDISIDPAMMSNPMAYRLRLTEIGKYIQEEIDFNASVIKNPNGTTVQQRQQALQSTAALNEFYDKIGLPQRVKSIEEAKKLPPGTPFIDENWIFRRVPEKR